MGKARGRVDTTALFTGMIGAKVDPTPAVDSSSAQTPAQTPAPAGESINVPKKAVSEKSSKQYSIHMTEDENALIATQCVGSNKKEKNKSEFILAAVYLLSTLSNDEYAALKEAAQSTGKTPGQIVQEALKEKGVI